MHAQHVTLTNLDWTLEAADMGASLGIPSVRFINDFQAGRSWRGDVDGGRCRRDQSAAGRA